MNKTINTYGTKSVWLKQLNAMNRFLTGWFSEPQYILLADNVDIKGLDKSEEEC